MKKIEENSCINFNQSLKNRCNQKHNCKFGINCIYNHTKYENRCGFYKGNQ